MIELLDKDRKKRPELFHWNGPIPQSHLMEFLESRSWEVPDDLVRFWQETGGGDLFESETILGPFGDTSLGDNLEATNQYFHEQGLPGQYLVFHVGCGISAVRLTDQKYVSLSTERHSVLKEYGSFAEWYECCLRMEYESRYGLSRT